MAKLEKREQNRNRREERARLYGEEQGLEFAAGEARREGEESGGDFEFPRESEASAEEARCIYF